jgi:hypothetical protein
VCPTDGSEYETSVVTPANLVRIIRTAAPCIRLPAFVPPSGVRHQRASSSHDPSAGRNRDVGDFRRPSRRRPRRPPIDRRRGAPHSSSGRGSGASAAARSPRRSCRRGTPSGSGRRYVTAPTRVRHTSIETLRQVDQHEREHGAVELAGPTRMPASRSARPPSAVRPHGPSPASRDRRPTHDRPRSPAVTAAPTSPAASGTPSLDGEHRRLRGFLATRGGHLPGCRGGHAVSSVTLP